MMRKNNKELIEELERIVRMNDYKYSTIFAEKGIQRVIPIPEETLKDVITQLKQLENIYNQ